MVSSTQQSDRRIGSVVGPVVGFYIKVTLGWKWIFNIIVIAGTVLNLLIPFCLWEGMKQYCSDDRQEDCARRHKLALRSRLDKGRETKVLKQTLMMPIRVLLGPWVFPISFMTAMEYAWMYTLYLTLPPTFQSCCICIGGSILLAFSYWRFYSSIRN